LDVNLIGICEEKARRLKSWEIGKLGDWEVIRLGR